MVVVPSVIDLYPHATSGTDKGQKNRIKLMAETKTHRLAFVGAEAELKFTNLDAEMVGAVPLGTLRFEAELVMLDMPAKSRHSLELHTVCIDAQGKQSAGRFKIRTQLEEGRRWIPISVPLRKIDEESTADAIAGAVRELRLKFEREDFGKFTKGRIALLRPRLYFEQSVPEHKGRQPKQIVLITTDTLRADVLGCYGNDEVKTPRIDRLAAEGTLFESAYATANVTNPSHTSMFTSLYLKDHGVIDNFTKLAPEVPTFLEPLREAGFKSAAFVSSFNFQPEKSDFDKRFDEFFPCEIYFERRAEDVNLDAFPWLVEHVNDDFFIWLHYFDVHMPYVPPFPYDRMYAERNEGKIELPIDYKGNLNWFSGTRAAGHYRAQYQGEVSYLDAQLGQLFDHMQALGMYDGATIALVSDHGESLGEHGVYCDHASLFDEVTRVPFLIKEPAHLNGKAAHRVDALVSTVDLYPTLFDLYGLKVPGVIRGHSLVRWMRGEEGYQMPAAYSTFARGIQESLRTDEHRFLLGVKSEELFPKFAVEAGKRELYRVEGVESLVEVTESTPDELSRLEALLTEFLADELDYESVPIDDEFIEVMTGLGYTQGDE